MIFRISLSSQSKTIGRSRRQADLVLEHLSVSRAHLELIRTGSGAAIIDLGSSNGTYLNGRQLSKGEKAGIHHGDYLKIGRVVMMAKFA